MSLPPLFIEDSNYAPLADITPSRLFFADPYNKTDEQNHSDMFFRDVFQQDTYLQPPAIYHSEAAQENQPLIPETGFSEFDEFFGDSFPYEFTLSDSPPEEPSELGDMSDLGTQSDAGLLGESPAGFDLEAEQSRHADEILELLDQIKLTEFMEAWISSPALRANPYWSRRDITRCPRKHCSRAIRSNLEHCLHQNVHAAKDKEYKLEGKQTFYCDDANCHYRYVGFSTHASLCRHKREIHENVTRLNQCKWCDKVFRRGDGARRHQAGETCLKRSQNKQLSANKRQKLGSQPEKDDEETEDEIEQECEDTAKLP